MENQKNVIVSALDQLDLSILAKDAKYQRNWDILTGYVKIIEHKASRSGRHDLLDMLWSVGLVYG
jgi:hypothetical protein